MASGHNRHRRDFARGLISAPQCIDEQQPAQVLARMLSIDGEPAKKRRRHELARRQVASERIGQVGRLDGIRAERVIADDPTGGVMQDEDGGEIVGHVLTGALAQKAIERLDAA